MERSANNALDAIGRPTEIGGGVVVEAYAASEGSDRPDDPKANALYRFELGGIGVCHMGDIGTPLSDDHIASLRGRGGRPVDGEWDRPVKNSSSPQNVRSP